MVPPHGVPKVFRERTFTGEPAQKDP